MNNIIEDLCSPWGRPMHKEPEMLRVRVLSDNDSIARARMEYERAVGMSNYVAEQYGIEQFKKVMEAMANARPVKISNAIYFSQPKPSRWKRLLSRCKNVINTYKPKE